MVVVVEMIVEVVVVKRMTVGMERSGDTHNI